MSSASLAGSEYSSTYSDSGSSYGYSSVSSAQLPDQVAQVARVRPRPFHQPALVLSVQRATPLQRLMLERPERPELSTLELCLGTVTIGAPLLLCLEAPLWGALAACSSETQLCLQNHLHLDS